MEQLEMEQLEMEQLEMEPLDIDMVQSGQAFHTAGKLHLAIGWNS